MWHNLHFKGLLAILAVVAVFAPSASLAQGRVSQGHIPSTKTTESPPVRAPWKENTTAVVKFCDRIVHPKDAPSYSQQFHLFIRKIGEKHPCIVVSIPKSDVECFKLTRASIFLKAAADENRIRKLEGLKPIKYFLHIPLKSFNDWNSLSDIQSLAVAMGNYIENDGIVSGMIFETSLIQTALLAESGAYGKEMNEVMGSNVTKFKKLLKSFQLTFGYELKMGLALNSYEQCKTWLVSDVDEIISLFDMIVVHASIINFVGADRGNEEQDATKLPYCIKLLQEKFQQFDFFRVGEIFDFKN